MRSLLAVIPSVDARCQGTTENSVRSLHHKVGLSLEVALTFEKDPTNLCLQKL